MFFKQRTVSVLALCVLLGQIACVRADVCVECSAKASKTLSSELVAAKEANKTLVGYTEDGNAILEVPLVTTFAGAQEKLKETGVEVLGKAPADSKKITNLIIAYETGQAPTKASIQQIGLQLVEVFEDADFAVAKVQNGVSVAAIRALETDPSVRFVEPQYEYELIKPDEGEIEELAEEVAKVPNDPSYKKLWGMINIKAPKAWDRVTGSPTIVVGVIDTGIDYSHADLAKNMWKNPKEIAGNGKDDDNNGFVDDVYGYDFVNQDGDPKDGHNHGTHVAGTVGAVGNNKTGVVGVNWQVKLMAAQIFAASGGATSQAEIARAIKYCVNNGAKVLNNSWGGGPESRLIKEAIDYSEKKNVLFIAAAGNHGENNDQSAYYPASYPNNNIVAVAAIDEDDKIADFSGYGRRKVDIGAPGVSVLSTVRNNRYASYRGTSMATPHVAGAAALVMAHPNYGNSSASQVKALLLTKARKIPALKNKVVTDGTLNIAFLGTRSPVAKAGCSSAYRHFRNVKITKTQTIGSVSFTLSKTSYVHFTCQTTAKLYSSRPAIISSGLYKLNNPSVVYSYSRRRTQFKAKGDIQPITTSFGLRLPAGKHTIYWNIWAPRNIDIRTDSGTMMVDACTTKAGGILVVQTAPEISRMQPNGTILSQFFKQENLDD
ncbi:MAG: S8 family peptidase [Gemmataceae bacterium]